MSNIEQTQNRLPRRFKNKLIRALRSGRYEKAVGTMKEHDVDVYNVLGVAYRQAGVPKQSITKMGQPNGKRYNFLPKVIYTENSPVAQKLAEINDKNVSFRWIASYLEENL